MYYTRAPTDIALALIGASPSAQPARSPSVAPASTTKKTETNVKTARAQAGVSSPLPQNKRVKLSQVSRSQS